MDVSPAVTNPDRLLAQAEALLSQRSTPQRHAQLDYQQFRRIYATFDALTSTSARPTGWPGAAPLSVETSLRLETIGQLLALSSGDYLDALRHRTIAEEHLATVIRDTGRPRTPESARTRADAIVTMGLTTTSAVDSVSGVAELRAATENGIAAQASPELLSEMTGLLALQLVFFGEHGNHPRAIDDMRATKEACSGSGPARAAGDIAELFMASARPATPPEALEAIRATADEHSHGTPYRHYYHYVMMLGSYVSKDYEQGLQHYAQATADAVWPRYNRRFHDMARLSRTLHLAAKGDFAAARRELQVTQDAVNRSSEGAGWLIHRFTQLRLDLAALDHLSALEATRREGPLGEANLGAVHLLRYLPLTMIIQGTALAREREHERAVECFLRATQQAVTTDEWFTLLAGETFEYRTWLESLNRDDLPVGLQPEVYDAVLKRPVYIQLELPKLTAQQSRILRLLAHGRAVTSIAAELHVTENTMKSHLQRLYRRLGVNSRDQAVLRANVYGFFDQRH